VPSTRVFPPQSPLSLVIGVTGHRDLRPEDISRLERVLTSALLDIHRKYPCSSAVLLSALAEGADRLTARIALDLGVKLVVPLPMRQDLYERDFETQESRAEFRDFLARAVGVVHLPLIEDAAEHEIAQYGPARDREYAKAGAYIAAHSQIFFALWDGTPDAGDKVGGTAQTVGFRLEGAQDPFVRRRKPRMFGAATGPVLHLETPRVSNPASGSLSCEIVRLLPPETSADSFDKICRRIDLFNQDARIFEAALSRTAANRVAGLLNTDAASAPAIVDSLPPGFRRLIGHYSAADGLALQFRARALSSWVSVYVGAAVSALFFNMHSSFFSVAETAPDSMADALWGMPWFLIAAIASSTFTAAWLYGRAEKGEYQTKYQDYRALAEALRIQFFWKIAGVAEMVVDRYLRKQHSELEWIRSALRSCDVLAAASGSTPDEVALPRSDRLGLVSKWIGDQRRYYSSKAKGEKAKLDKENATFARLLKLSGGLSTFLAIVLIASLSASAVWAAAVQRFVPSAWQHGAWMVIIPMLAVSAGLLHGYGQQLARAEHVRQFGRMSDLFYAAELELQTLAADEREDAAALVKELGIEVLDENGDWLILHRERPLEVPPS
jgi:hypothetical protein